jgi:IS605 OrfB family transposase
VKLIAKVKLRSQPNQRQALRDTIEAANRCADWISSEAWKARTFGQYDIHKLTYAEARRRFRLSAQVTVRAISKVADAYKLDKKTERTFRPTGSIAYDARILRWLPGEVSIWTVSGRLRIPFQGGPRQVEMLRTRQGESDLIFQSGKFYLAATCNAVQPPISEYHGYLGVDLGVSNIASDSDGERYSGSQIKSVRHRHRRLRAKLQRKQTRAAKRRLKKLSGKEARFAKHTNHVISKEIVASAKRTGRGIAVEDLTGIRDRIRAGRKQRGVLHSWAFSQLRIFLDYKAALAGVALVAVDPRNTSRECSECGHVAKKNRPNQSSFRCAACGFVAHADSNAARVISGRATCKLAELSELCESSHNSVKSRRL